MTSTAVAPAIYAWEPTDEAIGARYGVEPDRILRFDLNTLPAAPGLVAQVLARGGFRPGLSEYPSSDYADLVDAAATTYGVARDEILVGAGADEVLDLLAKAFLSRGGAAVIPEPTYSMYRVVTEQRGARAIGVPRRPAAERWAIDVDAVAEAAAAAELVWLCSPNNPTALAEPPGAVEGLLRALADRAARADSPPPVVVLDEAYVEFTGGSLVELRREHGNLVVVRTASKAYGMAGLRVGFAIADPGTIARVSPYRPPASISTPSAAVVASALRDGREMRAEVARVARERERFRDGLAAAGWDAGPSMTNFLLVELESPARAAAVAADLLRRGMVPRTFDPGHPLAAFLRLTVRDADGNDRLVAAAREIGP